MACEMSQITVIKQLKQFRIFFQVRSYCHRCTGPYCRDHLVLTCNACLLDQPPQLPEVQLRVPLRPLLRQQAALPRLLWPVPRPQLPQVVLRQPRLLRPVPRPQLPQVVLRQPRVLRPVPRLQLPQVVLRQPEQRAAIHQALLRPPAPPPAAMVQPVLALPQQGHPTPPLHQPVQPAPPPIYMGHPTPPLGLPTPPLGLPTPPLGLPTPPLGQPTPPLLPAVAEQIRMYERLIQLQQQVQHHQLQMHQLSFSPITSTPVVMSPANANETPATVPQLVQRPRPNIITPPVRISVLVSSTDSSAHGTDSSILAVPLPSSPTEPAEDPLEGCSTWNFNRQ